MALARKGSRTIVVEEVVYRWVVSEDGYMELVVEHEATPGQRLVAQVGFVGGDPITPRVVRRAVMLGLQEGWSPTVGGLAHYRLADAEARLWGEGA